MRYLPILLLLLSCNPVKRAMKQKEVIDQAVADYVLNNPVPFSELLVKGDTLVVRDTTYLPYLVWDTIVEKDTVKVVQVKTKLIREVQTVRDTIVRVQNNQEALNNLNAARWKVQEELKESEKTRKRQTWWIILLVMGTIILSLFHIKR